MRLFIGLVMLGLFCLPSVGRTEQKEMYKKKGPVGISGWTVFWDAGHKSLIDFEKHADQIDRVYFEFYHLTAEGLPEKIKDVTPELQARAQAAAAKNNVEQWWLIGNFNIAIMDHDKTWVEKFLYDDALRKKHEQMLIDFALKDKVKGIQIDYENILAKDKSAFSNFMTELGKLCKANNLYLGIALEPKTDDMGTWEGPQSRDYKAIGKVSDEFVPMTYDMHWSTSTAGAITAPEWAEQVVKYSTSVMDADRMEVGYPAYGYDWVGKVGETITYEQFTERAAKYHATPVRDSDYSQELHFDYTDDKGQAHSAWIPDSRALEYQCDIVKKYHLYGLAVWYFGSEDEAFWTTMKKVNSTTALTSPELGADTEEAPTKLKPIEFFTDTKEAMYQYAYPASDSKVNILDKKGKRWTDIVLKGDGYSGVGFGTDRTNLIPYLKKGALQFYIRGNKGGETLSGVGFVMDKGLRDDEKIGLENTVPLGNYCRVSTKWQMVTIPLADFANVGHHYDDRNGQSITGPFKWNRVIEFDVDHSPGEDPKMEIQFSSIRVIPSFNVKTLVREKESLQQ